MFRSNAVTHLSSEVGARRSLYEKKAIKENKAPPLISPCLPELYMLYPAVVEAINITFRSHRCFPSILRREERQKIRRKKKLAQA